MNQAQPCTLCGQYSHSLADDKLTAAFMHFQSMFDHRGDGIPTQYTFDAKTRDAAQVLMAAATSAQSAPVRTCQESLQVARQLAEQTLSLAIAQQRIDEMAGEVAALGRENIALRCLNGGGCYANDDGLHLTIIGKGKDKFCNDCGEMLDAKNCSTPWFHNGRLERAIERAARTALASADGGGE